MRMQFKKYVTKGTVFIIILNLSLLSYADFLVPIPQSADQIFHEGENPVIVRDTTQYKLSACLTIHKDIITLKLFIENKSLETFSLVLKDIIMAHANGEIIKPSSPAEVVVFKHGADYQALLKTEDSNVTRMTTRELMALDFPEVSDFNFYRYNLERGNMEKLYRQRREYLSFTSMDMGDMTFYQGDISGSSMRIGDMTFHRINDMHVTEMDMGNMSFYHGDISGSAMRIGDMTFYQGDISGSSMRIGDMKFNRAWLNKTPDYRYNYSPDSLPYRYYPGYSNPNYGYVSPDQIVALAMVGVAVVGLVAAKNRDILNTFKEAFIQGDIRSGSNQGGKIYYICKRKDIQYPVYLKVNINGEETNINFEKYVGRSDFSAKKRK